MKTVFLNGLFLDRNEELVRALAERFTVTGFWLHGLVARTGLPLVDAAEFVPEEDRWEYRNEARTQTAVLENRLMQDVAASPVGPGRHGLPWDEKYHSSLEELVAEVLEAERNFRALHAKRPVDVVISSADYDRHRRPVVLAGRELGVPTLNLEHGFYFNRMFSRFKSKHSHVPIAFASQYANFDNALEIELMNDHLADYPEIRPELLALGTPLATAADRAPDRATAEASLGLDATDSRARVLLLGSWIEARTVTGILAGQIETVDLFEGLFAELAARPDKDRLELLIKLHPAFCAPAVLPGVTACLNEMAAAAGLPAPRIFTDHLPELIAACDVVLSVSLSSALYDVFLLGKPSVLLMPRYLTAGLLSGWQSGATVSLREGIMEVASDPADAWRRTVARLEPGRQEETAAAVAAVKRLYGLGERSLVQKCTAICDWIESI